MGIYINESQDIVNMSVANNTHVQPANHGTCGGTSPPCSSNNTALSFCCFSNVTGSELIFSYPTREEELSTPSTVIDPWHIEQLESGGVCMSVQWSKYDEIASGTYSCMTSANNLVQQTMSIGVYSINGKNYS